MSNYPYTQADNTTELDGLANELGQLLCELDELHHRTNTPENARRIKSVEAAIKRIEQRCKELSK